MPHARAKNGGRGRKFELDFLEKSKCFELPVYLIRSFIFFIDIFILIGKKRAP